MTDTQFGPEGWTPDRLGSLEGPTYVITGANAGAGFEASRILLSKGAKVVMLNRSADKAKAAIERLKEEFGADADVEFIRMDLADLASVREAATEVLKTVPRIDALICNAAIAQVPTQKFTTTVLKASLAQTITVISSFAACSLIVSKNPVDGSLSLQASATKWG